MKLLIPDLTNRVRWLVNLRWIAIIGVVAVVWLTSSVFRIVTNPTPLYIIAVVMFGYNLLFKFVGQEKGGSRARLDKNIFLQITLDEISLALLSYFSGISHNPFIFYFVFHMIIAALLLRGGTPYFLAALASFLVGAIIILECLGWIPMFRLELLHVSHVTTGTLHGRDNVYLIGFFMAFSSTLWITVYLASSVQRYVHQAQAEIRQKEKMLGIGQLVAGIGHQISNPLDGIQNCLNTIRKSVNNDDHLTHYVELMTDALARIEQTAKRVQSFARPRGLKLQDTDVNKAVNATVQLLSDGRQKGFEIVTELGPVPPAIGDPYTLQEVIFNLCTNAIAAMPGGGKLSIRTFSMRTEDFSRLEMVGIEVADTGIGIPEDLIEKIFEPFFTTRAESGGTGLGLGLCRMLISEMGGWIEVGSVVGQGATFTITLAAASVKAKRINDENPGC